MSIYRTTGVPYSPAYNGIKQHLGGHDGHARQALLVVELQNACRETGSPQEGGRIWESARSRRHISVPGGRRFISANRC